MYINNDPIIDAANIHKKYPRHAIRMWTCKSIVDNSSYAGNGYSGYCGITLKSIEEHERKLLKKENETE
jgi:hypothetical protein